MTATPPSIAGAGRRRGLATDVLIAVVIASILSVGWAVSDWARLSHMLLPDSDDMMRLAQVRDWLGGQATNDWTQYRVAPPTGAPMHWSRVNDAGIAAIILAATPFVGRPAAEMVAVLIYPGLLFAVALFLSARIGRRLWGPDGGPVAVILTALAYPGTTIFIPGRIDHHALQVVLVQILALAAMRAPSLVSGIVAGVATAISLVIGLETAPQLAVLIALLAIWWVARGEAERARLGGFAVALGLATATFLVFLRPTLWTATYCDAFTPASSTGTLAAAVAFGLLAAGSPCLTTWQRRLTAGVVLGMIVLAIVIAAYPSCINGPYGVVDPFLRRAYIPFISEASSIFAARPADTIASGGLVAAACVAGTWMVIRASVPLDQLLPVAAAVAISAAVMLFQARGAYIGAPLAAPLLAGLVVTARRLERWRVPGLIGAWLVGAGIAWLAIPQQIERATRPAAAETGHVAAQASCNAGDNWEQVDRLPPGATMAGTVLAAYLVGATHHSTIGAGYHRNNAGNMAMYRFFLSSPDRAWAIAHMWHVRYVAFCPGDFGEIDVIHAYPDSLAANLQRGRAPAWLARVPLRDVTLQFYRIVP